MADSNPTVFGKILRGEIDAPRVYEDEYCIAFKDLQPQAPVQPAPPAPVQQIRPAQAQQIHHQLLQVIRLPHL